MIYRKTVFISFYLFTESSTTKPARIDADTVPTLQTKKEKQFSDITELKRMKGNSNHIKKKRKRYANQLFTNACNRLLFI